MPLTEWRLKGDWIKNCNCAFGCPCDFNARPTNGNCTGLVGMQITDGHFGDLRQLTVGGYRSLPSRSASRSSRCLHHHRRHRPLGGLAPPVQLCENGAFAAPSRSISSKVKKCA